MEPMTLALAIGAATAAAIAAWLIAAARAAAEVAAGRARLDAATDQVGRLEAELAARRAAFQAAHADADALREERTRLATQLDAERRAGGEKLAVLEEARVQLRDAFAALSREALEGNTRSFLELARDKLGELQSHAVADLDTRRQAIDELVRPLRESLDKVGTRLQEVETARAAAQSALVEQLRALALSQQTLQAETQNLSKALRSPNVRGHWGEIQLRRVVELAGMVAYCDFIEQPTAVDDQGARLTPDVLIRLPGGRNIVVDAKVPSAAYMEAVEAADEATREARLKDHARQVRDHVVRLGHKSYWDQFQPTPEFVFMFLPGETLLSAALQHDPALIEFGVGRRIIPATPTTLIALLRAVAYGWQQEKVTRNAEAVSRLGRELYERIRVMADHFTDVAKALGRSVDAYNRAIGSLEGRVLVTARRFRDLGVSAPDDIPESAPVDQRPRALQAPEFADLLDEPTVTEET